MGLTVHQGQWAYGGVGALGPIWGGALGRPKADIMEAEGRLNGGLDPLRISGPIGSFFAKQHPK